MNLLLDTHVLVWWSAGMRMSAAASQAIAGADEVFVSAASAWEVAIKTAVGKLSLAGTVAELTAEAGFAELPVLFRHTEVLGGLPLHHRDPFDRILIAQALVEGLVLVTRDPVFKSYGVDLISA